MVKGSSTSHALSDKASQRCMSQVESSEEPRESSPSTPKSSAIPLQDTEVIEKLTNILPNNRQAKVDSKAKTLALLGFSRSRERERKPKITRASAVSGSFSRASFLSMHSAAMDDQENTIDDTVLDN